MTANPPPVSRRALWDKCRSAGRRAGHAATENALLLYYTATAPTTPVWCRHVIYGALGYFISLVDGIPDLTPILGYTDDIGVMAAALVTIARHITPEAREKAREKTDRLFSSR